MPGRDDMREVELVEGVPSHDDRGHQEPARSSPDHEPPAGDGARRRHRVRRVLRWWPFAAAGVLALATTQAVIDEHARTRSAHLATVTGVLGPVDAAVHERWRIDGPRPATDTALPLVDGALVDGVSGADGASSVQLVDLSTGSVRWSTPLTPPDPVAAARNSRLEPRCLVSDPASAARAARGPAPNGTAPSGGEPLIVCLAAQDYHLTLGTVDPTSLVPRAARIVVLDPTSGTVLADRPTPASSSIAMLGELVVVGWVAHDAHAVITASEPGSGAVRWQFTSPAPMPARAGERLGITVTTPAGHVVARSASFAWWVLSGTGVLVRALPGGDASAAVTGARGGVLAVTHRGADGVERTTLLVDGTLAETPGADGAALAGAPVPLTVDDASAPGLQFTVERAHPESGTAILAAWDTGTGALRWSRAGTNPRRLILLDGTLYAASDDHLVAIDAASGDVRWDVPYDAHGTDVWPLTDGRELVVGAPGTTPGLAAFDLADGQRLWAVALPADVDQVLAVGGHLIGVGTRTDRPQIVGLS